MFILCEHGNNIKGWEQASWGHNSGLWMGLIDLIYHGGGVSFVKAVGIFICIKACQVWRREQLLVTLFYHS